MRDLEQQATAAALTSDGEYAELLKAIAWIDTHVANINLPTDERSLIGRGCFDVGIEHQDSIALLYKSGFHGSMLALLRVLVDSVVRGVWLITCANDGELERFKKGRIDKEFGVLIDEIEARVGHTNRVLSTMKAKDWKSLNDFTHRGYQQVTRRHSSGAVGANLPEAEIQAALSYAGALGLMAASLLAGMAGNANLVEAAVTRIQEFTHRAHRAPLRRANLTATEKSTRRY